MNEEKTQRKIQQPVPTW